MSHFEVKVFGLYDGPNLLFKGTASEIGKKIYMDKAAIYTYARLGKKYEGRYDIVAIKEEKKPTPEKPRKSKFEEEMDCIIYHLLRYGNTILPADKKKQADRYLNELTARGYDCDLKVYNSVDNIYLTLDESRRNHGRTYTDFIVTLKEAE